ncbi:lipocalin family protein [Pontibacter chitinilyticus]|uniref:lipocalin family protein n=1 Tax=Pontibacter chitinilyticus TaxID=2674989 RepID=UPI00321B7E0C
MNKNTKIIIGAGTALAAALVLTGDTRRKYAPLDAAVEVDLDRYQGRWYEIAKLPQRFEKGCHCVYAEYTKNPKGYVEVLNSCRKGGSTGKVKEIRGKGFPVEGSNNSKLKVQFFWPFKGDYWILELDPEYQHALVGSPDRESLWILSRKPTLSRGIFERLVQLAAELNFPVEQLTMTDQSCFT